MESVRDHTIFRNNPDFTTDKLKLSQSPEIPINSKNFFPTTD